MSREFKFTGIVLKKYPLNEGDEIVTVFTKESGKLKFLAKSIKNPKAKLQGALQMLFCLNLRTLKSGQIPKILSAEIVETFPNIRENLEIMKACFNVCELVLKFSAEGEKQPEIFLLLQDFLKVVNGESFSLAKLPLVLVEFKVHFLGLLGLNLDFPKNIGEKQYFFSNAFGGFFEKKEIGSVSVSKKTLELYLLLRSKSLIANGFTDPQELNFILTKFMEYYLEREIKSEKYLI
jgi:DNA repair protein RecO (recombination protein O)